MFRDLLSLVVLCCCFADKGYADIAPVRVGIENTYKNGLWTPITLEFPAPIKTLAIRCSDSDGTPITYRYEIDGRRQTADGSREKATVLAKLGRKDEPIQISIDGGEFKSFSVPTPVNAERPIYLVFGNEDIGLQSAIAELMLREERRPLLVKINSIADLPTEWFGYEAVEMVIMTTTDPQLFQGITKESPQIKALDDWLKLGGKMLLCAGKNSERFLEDENGFLHLFLPGKYDGMTEMRSGTSFERFVNSNRQIFMNGTDEAPFMKMPRISEPRGITILKDGDLPLVLRAAHGLGMLLYFAGDLSEKPLKNWRDRTALVQNIMQWNRSQERGALAHRSGAMLQLGYNDIVGQIRSALDQFEGVHVVPFSVILIILTAYWLVIGLFDWFFVHKVLKRPILTWVTFPLWILLFGLLTYVLASPGRPVEEKYNILHIIDVDYEADVLRMSMWENVYSPTDKSFGLHHIFFDDSYKFLFSVPPPPCPRYKSGYCSWFGLPGSGLGGMAPKTVSPSVWQEGSEQVSYNRIDNVPIQTRSTKSFFGQHFFTNKDDYRMTTRFSDEEGIPVGTIDVPQKQNFSSALENVILVYGRWAIELGEIQPGQTITVTKTTPRRDLRDLLIPPKALEDASLRGFATYNPQATDLEYIVRVMTLHKALGGYESTGLHHAYMPSLDMSDLLSVDKVLLLGTVQMDMGVKNVRNTIITRQSLPITLTESSPRWRGERYDPKGDALEEKVRAGWIE